MVERITEGLDFEVHEASLPSVVNLDPLRNPGRIFRRWFEVDIRIRPIISTLPWDIDADNVSKVLKALKYLTSVTAWWKISHK
jgi:hypothetical protein